jgi:hypothetical protein
MKNAVLWDVISSCPCNNRCFGRIYYIHHQDDKNLLLVSDNVVPSTLNLVTLTLEAIRSSETLVLTRATRHHIPEDGILNIHRRGNLKSYIR